MLFLSLQVCWLLLWDNLSEIFSLLTIILVYILYKYASIFLPLSNFQGPQPKRQKYTHELKTLDSIKPLVARNQVWIYQFLLCLFASYLLSHLLLPLLLKHLFTPISYYFIVLMRAFSSLMRVLFVKLDWVSNTQT